VAEEEDQRARDAYGNGLNGSSKALYTPDIRVNIPNANLLGKGRKGGDMDVIAIPFVFKYLCAELASMGIAISVEVK
jgi:DNA-directed RNA polymerase I subunit RPA2